MGGCGSGGLRPGNALGGKLQCASTTTINEVHDQMALHIPISKGFFFARLLITMVDGWLSLRQPKMGIYA